MKTKYAALAAKQEKWNLTISQKEKYLEEQRKIRLESRDKSIPEIKEFFSGKNVLVTGGTGFIGKVLIEKMLRSIPDVGKIYTLVRTKRNQDPAQRIAAIVNSDLFDLLRSQRPEALKKLVAIPGDMTCKGLALSPQDRDLLEKEVSIVFHAAATVRFDDPLKTAVLLNLRGTHEIIQLSKNMPNLKCFVHISTTYCNTDQTTAREIVYPTPFNWRDIIKLAETTPNEDLQGLSYKILGFQPNTYSFTKQLSEKCVDDARHEIPLILVRPAVVVSTLDEPFPGWTDNINGPWGICMGITKGILRTLYLDNNVNLNYITVDTVAKGLIASAWLRGTNQALSDGSGTEVVNISGEDIYDLTYDEILTVGRAMVSRVRPRGLRAPRATFTMSWLLYYYKEYTSQVMFSIFVDLILKMAGQKPRLLKISRTLHNVNKALHPFLIKKFYNSTESFWKVASYTTDPDFQFVLKVNCMEWSITSSSYILRNLMKEKEASPNFHLVLEVIHYIQQTIKYVLFIWLGWTLLGYLLQRYMMRIVIPGDHQFHGPVPDYTTFLPPTPTIQPQHQYESFFKKRNTFK